MLFLMVWALQWAIIEFGVNLICLAPALLRTNRDIKEYRRVMHERPKQTRSSTLCRHQLCSLSQTKRGVSRREKSLEIADTCGLQSLVDLGI